MFCRRQTVFLASNLESPYTNTLETILNAIKFGVVFRVVFYKQNKQAARGDNPCENLCYNTYSQIVKYYSHSSFFHLWLPVDRFFSFLVHSIRKEPQIRLEQ